MIFKADSPLGRKAFHGLVWWVLLSSLSLGLGQMVPFSRLDNVLYDLLMTGRNRFYPIAHDPRILVVAIEPSTFKAIPEQPVYWVPLITKVIRRSLDHGALGVGVDWLPTYADAAAVREFAETATMFRGKIRLIAYLDPELGLHAPPDLMLAALGVENLGLANVSLDQDGVARSQTLANVNYVQLGRVE